MTNERVLPGAAWTVTTGALLLSLVLAGQSSAQDSGLPPGVFAPDERLLTTYFFWRGPWDDQVVTSGGQLGMSGTWKAIFPSPDDPRAAIFGLDSGENWPGGNLPETSRWPATYKDPEQLMLWLMAEWRAMKWSGLDFVLVDVWNSLCFSADGSAQPCFRRLAEAWNEMDRRDENPLPMSFILETPFAEFPGEKDHDGTEASPDGITELWEPTWAFLRQFYGDGDYRPILPLNALARVDVGGEARPILHYWFPTWVDAGLKKWDAWTIGELRRKCRETFGMDPYIGVNQHVYGPDCMGGWSSEQPAGGRVAITSEAGVVDYDVGWWAGMAGPQVYHNAIAIGPGHWCPRQTGDKPQTLHWSAEYAPDHTRYEYCWRKVLSDPESFKRKLLIIESWNNSDEGCAINYSEPKDFLAADGTLIDRWGDRPEQYMELTRELAAYWKRGQCPERFRAAPPHPVPPG